MGRNLSAIAHEVQSKCILRFFYNRSRTCDVHLHISDLYSLFKTKWLFILHPYLLLFKRRHIEMIELINDGKGLGFGIVGGRSTGVIVKTVLPGGAAGQVNTFTSKTSTNSLGEN